MKESSGRGKRPEGVTLHGTKTPSLKGKRKSLRKRGATQPAGRVGGEGSARKTIRSRGKKKECGTRGKLKRGVAPEKKGKV